MLSSLCSVCSPFTRYIDSPGLPTPIQGQSSPTKLPSQSRQPPSPGPSGSSSRAPSNGSTAAGPPPATLSSGVAPVMQPVPTRKPQRTVGDWYLGKTLGAGSMGKVKLGSHVKTGAKVSFPSLFPRTLLASQRRTRARLARSTRARALLSSLSPRN